jgi:adenine phosphoribosyltransferase
VVDPDAAAEVNRLVVDVPDFPEPGVVFKDLTPVFADHGALGAVVAALAVPGLDDAGRLAVDTVAGIEARGFALGAPVALALGVGFVPVRKAGKLPRETHQVTYDLEYGQAAVEVHRDAFAPGERVLLVDDVLATGGTMAAARDLVLACDAVPVAAAVVLELSFLPGRATVGDLPVTSIVTV